MQSESYLRAKAIRFGLIKRLYLAGHHRVKGQAVSLEYVNTAPVRYYDDLSYARRVVERFNRRFGQKMDAIDTCLNSSSLAQQ